MLDFLKITGIAGLVSAFIYGGSGGGNIYLPLFVFFFIVTFYVNMNKFTEMFTEITDKSDEDVIYNKKFNKVFIVLIFMLLPAILTSLVTGLVVDYCDGIFKNEESCEISKIKDKYSQGESNYSEERDYLR